MDKELPDRYPASRIQVLECIRKKMGNSSDIIRALKTGHKGAVYSGVSELKTAGYIDTNKDRTHCITPLGIKLLEDKTIEHTGRLISERRNRNDGDQQSLSLQPEPIQSNISATANVLADNITQLIAENEQYRNVLLNVYTTIGRSLQLEQGKEYGDSTEN
jgi:hypothetical protein